MNKIHYILICLSLLVGNIAAQSPTKKARKADKYYKMGQYALAIPLYKEALSEADSRAWTYKLANSYRLTNQTADAQQYYDRLFEDPKRLRSKAYKEYSEVLMSNGKYAQSKEILAAYIAQEPADSAAAYLLANMDKIEEIPAQYPAAVVQPYAYNSAADDHGAVYWNGGLVFVSDRKQRGFNIFKEKAGATGRDFLSLYFSPIDSTGATGTPDMLPRKINVLNKHTGPASFTLDGKTIVYSQNDHSEADRLSLQLFTAQWEEGKWRDVRKIDFCKPGLNYMHPAITPDGDSLYFVMDKKYKAQGGTDIYVSALGEDGEWKYPQNLGPIVNTSENEGFPFVDTLGTLYFCSKGYLGYGGFDIFRTQQDSTGKWQPPVNLGRPINSPQDDISFCLAPNGKEGYFASSREGGDDDIFYFYRKENNRRIQAEVTTAHPIYSTHITPTVSIRATPIDATGADVVIESQEENIVIDFTSDQPHILTISKAGFQTVTQEIDPKQWKENDVLKIVLYPVE